MKKFIVVLFVLSLLCVPSAFALMCEQSQAVGGGDACYTQVTVSPTETTLVSQGTVLVRDIAHDTLANSIAYVRVATASADGAFVVGVAQKRIASGATDMVLVRGSGKVKIKTNTLITSGDQVWVSTSGDAVSVASSTTLKPLGYALSTAALSGNTYSTTDAYITIV